MPLTKKPLSSRSFPPGRGPAARPDRLCPPLGRGGPNLRCVFALLRTRVGWELHPPGPQGNCNGKKGLFALKVAAFLDLIPGPDHFGKLFFVASVAAIHVGMQNLD